MNTETLFAKQASDLAVTRLLLQMEVIEEQGDVSHVDTYDALSQSVATIADVVQLEELSTRSIPERWVKILSDKSAFTRGEIHTGAAIA